jgi:hypothetical protein
MDEEKIGKLSGVVPEMWHDLIARITPGLIVLYTIYGNAPESLKGISIGGFAGAIIIAYLLGLVTDLLSAVVTDCFASVPLLKRWFLPLSFKNYHEVDELKSPARELVLKMLAEVVLCRSLFYCACAQLIAAAWKALGFATPKILLIAFGSLRGFPWEVSLIATVAAGVCWCRINSEARRRLDSLLKLKEKGRGTTLDRFGFIDSGS